MSTPTTVLVIGGTGQQGGATINALLQQQGHFTIRTISRNPNSPSAKKLTDKGVQVFKADVTDKSSLVPALKDVEVLYFMTDNRGPQGAAGEVTQGKAIVAAAQEAGIKRIVFSSVQSADRTSSIGGVPHFESKLEVEKLIKASGIQWTILRPVAFMDFVPLSGSGRYMTLGLVGALLGKKKLQFIAVEDIGIVAAKAIAQPEEFNGKTIDLAGDDLSVEEVQAAFKKVTGENVGKAPLPHFMASFMLPYDMKQMFKFFDVVGYDTNIAELKRIHPSVMTYEEYLRKKIKAQ